MQKAHHAQPEPLQRPVPRRYHGRWSVIKLPIVSQAASRNTYFAQRLEAIVSDLPRGLAISIFVKALEDAAGSVGGA